MIKTLIVILAVTLIIPAAYSPADAGTCCGKPAQTPVLTRVEIYEMAPEIAKGLGSKVSLAGSGPSGPSTLTGFADPQTLKTLKAQLAKLGIKPTASPVISTPSGQEAKMVVGGDEKSMATRMDLLVLPRVNKADSSITIKIEATITTPGTPVAGPDGKMVPVTNTQSVSTTRRMRSGDSVILLGMESGKDKPLMVIVTPEIGK